MMILKRTRQSGLWRRIAILMAIIGPGIVSGKGLADLIRENTGVAPAHRTRIIQE